MHQLLIFLNVIYKFHYIIGRNIPLDLVGGIRIFFILTFIEYLLCVKCYLYIIPFYVVPKME